MEFWDVITNFFREGGVFLYPIALTLAVGVAIAIERFIYVTRTSAGNKRFWAELQPMLEKGAFKAALAEASKSETALAKIMQYGLSRVATARRRDDVEKAVEESLVEVIPRLEKRTHFLATLANIGMLMGLLGTVIGLIHAFAAVASANPAEKASLLAASISVAMNNTALGLIVAITLLLAHMYLESKTTELIDSFEVASIKFLNCLVEHRDVHGGVDAAVTVASGRDAYGAQAGGRCAGSGTGVSGSRLARRQARNHGRYRGRNDLNIVPMLDVMVILVFFLIFTAVFSKTNVLELSLPAPSSDMLPLPPQLELEVIVRNGSIEVADRSTGPLKVLRPVAQGYDLEGLTGYLKLVKAKYPEKSDATILLAPDVSYDTLVQVMDAVRTFEVTQSGQVVRGELFPQVAVGDAPT